VGVPLASGGDMKAKTQSGLLPSSERRFWITPISGDEVRSGEETLRTLLGKGIYGLGRRTPGRKSIKPNDMLCFYVVGRGVAAHARVVSPPERRPDLVSAFYPLALRLDDVHLYLDSPVSLNRKKLARLDAFGGRGPIRTWGWFVTGTHSLTEHDFGILTRNRA
jgi:hypothetical protein